MSKFIKSCIKKIREVGISKYKNFLSGNTSPKRPCPIKELTLISQNGIVTSFQEMLAWPLTVNMFQERRKTVKQK